MKSRYNSLLSFMLSASTTLLGIQGCAASRISQKPNPLEQIIQYKSKFEESVIRDMPRGFERDYYASLWNLFNVWYPKEVKKDVLSSIDTLSVITQRPIVDSLINIYTLPLDKHPDEPGNQFLQRDFPEIINWCNDRFVTHPSALYLIKYLDDVGILVLGKGIPKDVNMPRDEKAITTSRVRFEGPPVDTWRITWDMGGGEYVFQDDGYGYWRWLSNSLDETRAQSEKDPHQRVLRALTFTGERKNIEFKQPIAVKDEDKKLDRRSVDLEVLPIITEDLSSSYALINLGISLDHFVEDDTLTVRARYRVTREGSEQTFYQDSLFVDTPIIGYSRGSNDITTFQKLTPLFPIVVGKGKSVRYILGIDIENGDGKHYKTFKDFFVGIKGNYYGWLVDPREKTSFLGRRQPIAFENLSPGDKFYALLQLPYIEDTTPASLPEYFSDSLKTPVNVRLHFASKPTKSEVIVGSVGEIGQAAKEDSLGNIIEPLTDFSRIKWRDQPTRFERGEAFTVASIYPSRNTLNLVESYVPEIKGGFYDIIAEATYPNLGDPVYVTIRDIYIKKENKK